MASEMRRSGDRRCTALLGVSLPTEVISRCVWLYQRLPRWGRARAVCGGNAVEPALTPCPTDCVRRDPQLQHDTRPAACGEPTVKLISFGPSSYLCCRVNDDTALTSGLPLCRR